ncbi:hypothetical protein PIECOFPK_01823 [Mycovorax composti]|uniref:Uncharacterized protein n=2 Tax=Chitinophagaceae TaxID=563835 RepID=A0ABZ2EKR2_9BACT
MKKTFIAILITQTLLGNVSAQTNRADSFKADKEEMQAMMIAYKEKLNLSSEQERKMEAINKQYIADLNAIKSSNATKLNKLKKLRAANERKDQQMKKILNSQQYAIYKAEQEKIKQKIKENRNN